MDPIKMLEQQHREVESLFTQFHEATRVGDHPGMLQLFHQIADRVSLHSTLEEKIFYPSILAMETEGLVEESHREHLAVKRIIADLLDLEASDAIFAAKVRSLEHEIAHHVRQEETDLFVRVRSSFTHRELSQMAEQMHLTMDEIREDQNADYAFMEMTTPTPLH